MNPLDLVRAEFALTVLKQRPVVDEQRRLERFLARQPDGLRLVMLFVDEQARADNRFFREYRGYIVKPFSEWSGYHKDEAHKFFQDRFATFEHRMPNGNVVPVTVPTHLMTNSMFREYIDRCRHFLIEKGCPIPQRRQEPAA